MAVLLSESRNPQNTAVLSVVPAARASTATASTVSATCSVPPRKTARRMRARLCIENSSPMVNMSRITPSSATWSTLVGIFTSPSAYGPASIPVTKNPMMEGSRSRIKSRVTPTESSRMTSKSYSKEECMASVVGWHPRQWTGPLPGS